MSAPRNTFFGDEIDQLARRIGGWPDTAIVFKLHAANETQVLLTGANPNGKHRKDGRPMIDRKTREFFAACSIEDYRASFANKAEVS